MSDEAIERLELAHQFTADRWAKRTIEIGRLKVQLDAADELARQVSRHPRAGLYPSLLDALDAFLATREIEVCRRCSATIDPDADFCPDCQSDEI